MVHGEEAAWGGYNDRLHAWMMYAPSCIPLESGLRASGPGEGADWVSQKCYSKLYDCWDHLLGGRIGGPPIDSYTPCSVSEGVDKKHRLHLFTLRTPRGPRSASSHIAWFSIFCSKTSNPLSGTSAESGPVRHIVQDC
jgi:hypothetical protein